MHGIVREGKFGDEESGCIELPDRQRDRTALDKNLQGGVTAEQRLYEAAIGPRQAWMQGITR